MKQFKCKNIRPIRSLDNSYLLLDIKSTSAAASMMLEICLDDGFYITNQFCHSHMYAVSKVADTNDEEVIADRLQDFYDDIEVDACLLFNAADNDDYAYDKYIDLKLNGGL